MVTDTVRIHAQQDNRGNELLEIGGAGTGALVISGALGIQGAFHVDWESFPLLRHFLQGGFLIEPSSQLQKIAKRSSK